MTVLKKGGERVYPPGVPLAEDGAAGQLEALSRALSGSPLWAGATRSALVVRSSPEPLLAVFGSFDEAGRARLERLRWQIENVLPGLRYVGYEQAEEDCALLAGKLRERFSRDELETFRFAAMPRGGFIVLGMLAYLLGLRRSQMEPPHSPDAPLVVVDDCAMSGLRFGEFMERSGSGRVIFAHLYSTPELRAAVEEREGVACVAARDLTDRAHERMGGEYAAWRERWAGRAGGHWVGQPEQVCFAWNEPNIRFWNPATDLEEAGWALVPPELCLKNLPEPGAGIPVQIQAEGKGPLRPAPGTLFAEIGGEVVVGGVEGGESFALDGAAADMWRAIVEYGDVEEILSVLSGGYDVEEETLRGDLDAFIGSLLSEGLVERDG